MAPFFIGYRHLRDFGFGKASMQDLIVEEFQDIVELLKKKKGEETEVNFLFNSASLSVIWRIVTGRGVDRENARQQVRDSPILSYCIF